jgi:hypothetical protein
LAFPHPTVSSDERQYQSHGLTTQKEQGRDNST